jgi:hypothetical protein
MKMLVSMFTALLLTACSSFRSELNQTDERIDKEFSPHVIEFQREFRQVVRMPINFGIEEPQLAGVCLVMEDGFRQILINKKTWGSLSHDQKEELIFHELGHCKLNLGHIEGQYLKTGCPLSLMAPVLFSKHQALACYSRHKDYYLGQIKVGIED